MDKVQQRDDTARVPTMEASAPEGSTVTVRVICPTTNVGTVVNEEKFEVDARIHR